MFLYFLFFFFFNDPATTEIYTLSLHDALPISLDTASALAADDYIRSAQLLTLSVAAADDMTQRKPNPWFTDRKSTRLNSSHLGISYAVFCLKKKKKKKNKTKKKQQHQINDAYK